jgi:hypothetical protein
MCSGWSSPGASGRFSGGSQRNIQMARRTTIARCGTTLQTGYCATNTSILTKVGQPSRISLTMTTVRRGSFSSKTSVTRNTSLVRRGETTSRLLLPPTCTSARFASGLPLQETTGGCRWTRSTIGHHTQSVRSSLRTFTSGTPPIYACATQSTRVLLLPTPQPCETLSGYHSLLLGSPW